MAITQPLTAKIKLLIIPAADGLTVADALARINDKPQYETWNL
jgi:hypothetical protein